MNQDSILNGSARQSAWFADVTAAGVVALGNFDLDRRVLDLEAVRQLASNILEQPFRLVCAVDHEMAREGDFTAADRPDMKAMQSADAGDSQQ